MERTENRVSGSGTGVNEGGVSSERKFLPGAEPKEACSDLDHAWSEGASAPMSR